MLIFLMLNVILLPVAIAFFHDTLNPGWLTFNIFSDFVFIVDIVLNFWTGIVTDENRVILNLKDIRILYAKKWLAIDVLSIFPFDYIAYGFFRSSDSTSSLLEASKALRLLRLLKLLSLLRLFRVARFLHYLNKWEEVCVLYKNEKSMYAKMCCFYLQFTIRCIGFQCYQVCRSHSKLYFGCPFTCSLECLYPIHGPIYPRFPT